MQQGMKTPGPYDGFLMRKGGGWEVAAAGVPLGTFASEEVARAVLAEHGAGRACWKVEHDGAAERITVS